MGKHEAPKPEKKSILDRVKLPEWKPKEKKEKPSEKIDDNDILTDESEEIIENDPKEKAAVIEDEPTEEHSERKLELPKISMPKLPEFKKPDLSAFRAFFDRCAQFFGKLGTDGATLQRTTYSFSREQVFTVAGAALFFFILWLLPTSGWLRFGLYLLPFILLAVPVFQDAFKEIVGKIIPGRNLLIAFSALVLLCLKQAHVAVFVLFLHRVFLLLESYLYEKKASMLDVLREQIPGSAIAVTEDGAERKAPEDFVIGDILYVPAGETAALDGVVTEGISSLDTSALTGNNVTYDVGVGSRVFAGSKNLTNPLKLRVTSALEDCAVSRAAARVEKASASEPSRADLLQRILSYLPVCLSVLGLIFMLIVASITGKWSTWIYRGVLLIVLGGCGDTLLAARMAYFTGVFDAAKEGVLFADADAIDKLSGSDLMIFSKTGTITEGKYEVAGVYPVDYEEKDLLTIAALAECQSEHPIAKALRNACGIDIHHRSDITLLEETPGRGIHTLFGGRNVYVGNSTLLLEHNIVFDVPTHKGTVIHVAVDNKYAGCIVLSDRVRDNAFDAIEELRLRGIRAAVMLTGDVRSMARPIASSLGFDMVKCELSNEAKLDALRYLRENKGNRAAISYVSSKAEDLELLAGADVGIAFAALTEEKPMDEASVLIQGSQIFQIPQALFLAKRITAAALIDAAIMLGLYLLLIVLGAVGAMSIWLAMVLILLARLGTLIYSIYFK